MEKYSLIFLQCCVNYVLIVLAKPFEPSSNFPLDDLAEVHVTKRRANIVSENREPNDLLVDGLSDTYEFDVKIKVMETVQNLKLKSPESIFLPGFKFGSVGADLSGKPIFSDRTPSKQLIESIEKDIYIDVASDAALSLRHINGEFDLHGYVNGARIKRAEDGHFVFTRETERVPSVQAEEAQRDVVDKKRPIAMRRGFSLGKPTEVISEVLVVFDYEISKTFGFDSGKALEYACILFNSVNNRFSTSPDPKITFKLSAVYITELRARQDFIEAALEPEGIDYDYYKILDGFSKWFSQYRQFLPKFDTCTLLTAVRYKTERGVSFLKGACYHGDKGDSEQAISVSQDNGMSWSGVDTLTHDLAHNHGSEHDGDGTSADCAWDDGFIMSNEGWGSPNKFFFSECSRRQMKIFIESTGGACLWSKERREDMNNLTKSIGEVLDRDEHCRILTRDRNAVAVESGSGDEFCRRTVCKTIVWGRVPETLYQEAPGDYTPCGVGGKCLLGVCVNSTQTRSDLLNMNRICQTRLLKDDAVLVDPLLETTPPDEQCQVMKCESKGYIYTIPGLLPDNAWPCGKDGNCVAGVCVNNTENPRDLLDLNIICRKRFPEYTEVFHNKGDYNMPDEHCWTLTCLGIQEDGTKDRLELGGYRIPENAFPCGKDGHCVKGACVDNSEDLLDYLDLNKVCKKIRKNETTVMYTSDISRTPYDICNELHCTLDGDVSYEGSKPIHNNSFPCAINGVCRELPLEQQRDWNKFECVNSLTNEKVPDPRQ